MPTSPGFGASKQLGDGRRQLLLSLAFKTRSWKLFRLWEGYGRLNQTEHGGNCPAGPGNASRVWGRGRVVVGSGEPSAEALQLLPYTLLTSCNLAWWLRVTFPDV